MTTRIATTITACVLAALGMAGTAAADGGAGTSTAWPGSAALAGAWTGTATSTTDSTFTFPASATVEVSATGRPTGRSYLGAPVDCSGTWIPVSRSGATFTFTESITQKVGTTCINGGTVRLSAASGGRLRYAWSKGDGGSVAFLRPAGVSGLWSGTLRQAGLAPTPVRIRVVGVRAGQMQGTSRYGAPLSCSGTLTPVRGTQRRTVLAERITRSTSTDCLGTGTMTLSLRPDGRLAYRWTGGGLVSTAILGRVR